MPVTVGGVHNVFDLLDREWARLRLDRRAARRMAPVCRLAGGGVRDLGDLERHVRTADPADADRILLALVTRVVDHDDQLAARVVLQLLLPGTRNLARRWWALGDHDERAAAAVGAVYDRIRTYPSAGRAMVVVGPGGWPPTSSWTRPASSGGRCPGWRRWRRPIRRHTTGAPTTGPSTPAAAAPPTPPSSWPTPSPTRWPTASSSAATPRSSPSPGSAGRRIADLAAQHRVGSRTLWDRRQRAERRLAGTGTRACA